MSGIDDMFAGTKAQLANLSIRKECGVCGAMVKNLDLHTERLHGDSTEEAKEQER